MSSSERTPLLTADEPPGKASMLTPESLQESTPLLSTSDSTLQYDGRQGNFEDSDAVSQEEQREELRVVTPSPSISGTGQISADSRAGKEGRRWPSIIAIFFLTLLSIILIIVAFIAPAAVEEYAKQAVVLEPTNLSLESITSDGVQARVQAKFKLDASRVQKDNVRRVGRAATWVLRRLGTGPTNVTISVPEYDHVIVGSVSLPPLIVDIVDGHTTTVDFVAELIPGDADGIRAIANQWLEGRLDLLKLRGFADIRLQSGIVPLGTHRVSETLVFEAKELPAVPEYNITRLNFHEALGPDGDSRGMAAEVSLEAFNKYPVSLDVPELAFEILVPGCSLSDAYIIVSEAITKTVAVRPRSSVVVEVNALIRSLPDQLTRTCPDSSSSPLDLLLKQYLGGEEATVFVRGASHLGGDVPGWVVDILSSITVPAPFPGRSFDSLIRNFSLTDVSFTLPNPMADPHDPDASPKVSGVIEVLAVLPSEMNFNITVNKVRANADVFHEAKKLGELNLRRWQRAQSSKVVSEDGKNTLQIRSSIKDAPLDITDADVLTDVIESLLSGDDRVVLDINAKVDVKVQTVLGPLVLKDVPADGKVPLKRAFFGPALPLFCAGCNALCTDVIKAFLGEPLTELNPRIGNITILNTTPASLTIESLVNITNPTDYTAHIPSVSIHVISNGSLIGEARAQALHIVAGNNTNLPVTAVWRPSMGGDDGVQKGRDLLSGYLSGFNTTVTIRTHRDSIPFLPHVGEALSRINLTISAPRISLPGDEESRTRFIRDATFHVFSSMATFTLFSPLQRNTAYIDHVNATAYYNHTEPIGHIEYAFPFACPPGMSETPKLPVEWSVDSVGYEKLKNALGGHMKLDAKAIVGLRVGAWTETVWYVGKGIGAKVRL